MKNPFSSITQSLAKKLIITVGIIIIGGGSLSWYTLISNNRKNLMNSAVEYTASYSDLVKKSLRYSMLVFSREPIQHTIEGIGATEGIKNIKIYDSRGRIFYSSRKADVGQFAEIGSFSCSGCHAAGAAPRESLDRDKKWISSRERNGESVLTFVDPIYNEPSCFTAACHVHSPNQKVLGILESDFSISSVDKKIRTQAVHAAFFALGLIGISSVILYFTLRRFVLEPLAAISGNMKKVASGDPVQTISVRSRDEMGILATSFNIMTGDLRSAKEKVDNWTLTLESEIEKKKDELKKSQNKLIQAEKLAALGRLTSDVAHRIRNPLTSIGGFAHKLEKVAEGERAKEYAGIVAAEVTRLEKILRDILAFSRESGPRMELKPAESLIHDVMTLYEKECGDLAVKLNVSIGENLPKILIDLNQAKQGLNCLIANALDAMPDGGSLSLRAGGEMLNDVEYIVIEVSDTGSGIPPEKMSLIFEPFFSINDVNGTGLGLSITRKIMEEHGGFIKAESTFGKGSVFTMYFPTQDENCEANLKCWEHMKCGRDSSAAIKCPAYPHFGRICWAVAGTFCEGKAQGTFAQKYENCRKCEYYKIARK